MRIWKYTREIVSSYNKKVTFLVILNDAVKNEERITSYKLKTCKDVYGLLQNNILASAWKD
jgi:hypothetical protein